MRQNKQFSDLVNAAFMAGVSIYIAERNAVSTKKAMRTATKFMRSVLGSESFSRDSIRQKLRRIHARIQQGETIEQALRDKRKDLPGPTPFRSENEKKEMQRQRDRKRLALLGPEWNARRTREWRHRRQKQEIEMSFLRLKSLPKQNLAHGGTKQPTKKEQTNEQ
jgi:hypothetical protein